jgi:photosystem II stability/assembly factor-like uncharacterized protein
MTEGTAMATADTSHVFVGAAQLTGGTLGGLFRQRVGDDRWERLTKGLPDPPMIQAVTVHPTDPRIVFVGTQDGPYRSDDGGTTFKRPDFPRDLQVWSVTVHPTRPRTIYAGTSPVGVFRSEDGGDTWTRLANAVQPEKLKMSFACRVMRIGIEPGQPDQIHAALEVGGTMRSLDGGETWSDGSADLVRLAADNLNLKSMIQSDSEAEGMLDAHALAVSSAAPGNVFLAVRMGLFQSRDRGQSWHDMQIDRFSPLTYGRDIRVSPHDPRVLYACLSPAAQSTDGALYRSDDSGGSWRRFDRGVKAEATMMGVALHPRDPDQVYGVTRCGQIFGTRDGGHSWHEHRLPAGCEDTYAIACG